MRKFVATLDHSENRISARNGVGRNRISLSPLRVRQHCALINRPMYELGDLTMRLSQLATIVIPFVATPASAEIECVGHLVPSVVGGYYKAQVRCTNTEPANQGYKCSGTWKLIAEDDKVYEFIDPVGTVMKGAKDAFKYENDRVGYGGLKIKGQAHPYEGKCEL